MNEKLLVLERDIERDLEILNDLWDRLASDSLDGDVDEDRLAAIGYRLHNLYSACENIFRNIAQTFENELDDSSGWHAQLLSRMRLDLRPLRPAVIDAGAFEKFDELRRFRHLFRAAYGIELDPERMALVLRKARALRDVFPEQMVSFASFLRELRKAGQEAPSVR